jgi:hypothetical protein
VGQSSALTAKAFLGLVNLLAVMAVGCRAHRLSVTGEDPRPARAARAAGALPPDTGTATAFAARTADPARRANDPARRTAVPDGAASPRRVAACRTAPI